MDLRKIVAEVEERKAYELSLVGSSRSPRPTGGGAAGSLLLAVRERMLTEDPEADVGRIDDALHGAEGPQASSRHKAPASREKAQAPPADDFLERYLELSVEFEERYGVRGWADFVAKKTEAHRHHAKHKAPHKHAPAKAAGSSKPRAKAAPKGHARRSR